MRIGIISPALRVRGGIERVPVMQAKLLSDHGYDVCLITSVYEENCYPELLLGSKVKIRTPRIRSPILEVTTKTIFSAFQSYRLFSDCDIIISHILADTYNAIHKLDIPCILYLHTLPRHPKRSVAEAVDRRFRRAIMIPSHILYTIINPVILRQSDRALMEANIVLVNSKNIGKQLMEYCGRKDYVVCYPAVDAEHLERWSSEVEAELVNKYSLGENVILSVSRHQPKKCLHWLPEILHYILTEVPNAQIIITGGETPHTSLIRESMKKWGVEERIVLVGEVNEDELAVLYHRAKALCFPSVREDFGMPIVEAMFCGCPPVAWDDDSGPSEIITDGVDGLLVKPYNFKAMAQKLTILLKDKNLRNKLAENASTKAQIFSWSSHMAKLESGIKKLMGEDGRRLKR